MPQPNRLSGAANGASNGVMARTGRGGDTLADILERVLDKGVVIVGDIGVDILDIQLLTLRVRLLIASVDTARDMGIDWWTGDPSLSSGARRVEEENRELRRRIRELESEPSGQQGEG
jgi:Gas vesicle protein